MGSSRGSSKRARAARTLQVRPLCPGCAAAFAVLLSSSALLVAAALSLFVPLLSCVAVPQDDISRVLLDSKVDVSLDPPGYGRIPAAVEKLEAALRAAEGGFLPLHDKSAPDDVRAELGMSKKVFKQALGALYKEGRVRLAADGTQRVD